jgi:hypothetical protein
MEDPLSAFARHRFLLFYRLHGDHGGNAGGLFPYHNSTDPASGGPAIKAPMPEIAAGSNTTGSSCM